MNVLNTLQAEADQKGLEFLIIGGLAINQYGWSRETADVDIFARKEQKEIWLAWFQEIGYSIYHDAGSFTQLTPPQNSSWPVDFMWVADQTFTEMFGGSATVKMGSATVRVPSLDHLLALKLHSLKNTRIHRFLKDFQDVVGLIEINKLDPASEKIRHLFQKYANEEIYGKVLRATSKN